MSCTVRAEVSNDGLKKTNSLRQFNYAQILGVPTAAGMVPVIYPILLHSKCTGGVRGIVFYGGTFDGRCGWYDQCKDTVSCDTTASYRYNQLDTIVDEEKDEIRFQRHRGTAVLHFPKTKTIYKGSTIYKAPLTLKPCDDDTCCFAYPQQEEEVEEPKTVVVKRVIKQKAKRSSIKSNSSCGCGGK